MGTLRTDLRADIGALTTRVNRHEQPARIDPIRNINPPSAAARGNENPIWEEEPPDHPLAQDPLQDNLNLHRDHAHRNRPREEEVNWHIASDIKLTPPTFAGKVCPSAYLDWERRMEYINDYFGYTYQNKVALASVHLKNNVPSWWDREVAESRRHHHPQITNWRDMKFHLRRRYVPSYYHSETQKRFRTLFQGHKSVKEY